MIIGSHGDLLPTSCHCSASLLKTSTESSSLAPSQPPVTTMRPPSTALAASSRPLASPGPRPQVLEARCRWWQAARCPAPSPRPPHTNTRPPSAPATPRDTGRGMSGSCAVRGHVTGLGQSELTWAAQPTLSTWRTWRSANPPSSSSPPPASCCSPSPSSTCSEQARMVVTQAGQLRVSRARQLECSTHGPGLAARPPSAAAPWRW